MDPRWPHVLDLLKSHIGERDFSKWIKPTRMVSTEDGAFTIEAPNNFIKNWIQLYYDAQLRRTIASVYNTSDVALNIIVTQTDRAAAENRDGQQALVQQTLDGTTATLGTPTSVPPNPAAGNGISIGNKAVYSDNGGRRSTSNGKPHTFENFVVGTSNQFAHAASLAAAEAPGEIYNPLFIYGGVGLGKTHLLNAVTAEIQRNTPSMRICYMSSERFINNLINSLRLKKMEEFRRRYRNGCDVLLIDDIQFIAGKERSQEEFFHTFNALYELKRQIILTSDKIPKEIPGLEERLRSRFESGLIADIQPPELETRIAILERKAEEKQVRLPDDVALFLAANIKHNIRELEGCLTRLTAYASLTGQSISLEFAKQVFKDIVKSGEQVTVEAIQQTVANAFNIKTADLKSERKFKYIALPRQIAMYLCRKFTKSSFPDIGLKFGCRDHSTVVHAVKKIESRIATDTSLKNTVESIEKTICFGARG